MGANEQQSDEHRWKNMGNVEVLKRWAQQLKALKEGGGVEQWELAGRFVMLVHPVESCRIRLLELVANEAGFRFVIGDGDVLIEKVLSDEPYIENGAALVYVPQGKWSAVSDEDEAELHSLHLFRRKLGDYLNRYSRQTNTVFVTSGDSYSDLNVELRTAGSIDRRFLILRPSFADIGNSFLDLVGRGWCANSLIDFPERVGMLLELEFDDERRQGLVALSMRRMAREYARGLTYEDLLHVGVRGSGDIDLVPEQDEKMLKRVAIHEAGHALMAYFDSDGMNVPDYVTVLPGHQFKGVSADSYGYMGSIHGKHTYEDSRHKIRVLLAGRAAESLVLGRTKVGTFGSKSDLINASNIAKELMGSGGFSDDIDFVDCASRNLLVPDEEPSQSEQEHIEGLARKYLAFQYEQVEKTLQTTAGLLIELSEQLMCKQVLFQSDVKNILTLNFE